MRSDATDLRELTYARKYRGLWGRLGRQSVGRDQQQVDGARGQAFAEKH